MVTYYRPAIDFGSIYHLTPPITRWTESDKVRYSLFAVPPNAGRILGRRVADGLGIDISGLMMLNSWDALNDQKELLRTACQGGATGKFKLWRYHDRYWDKCVCTSGPTFTHHPGIPKTICEYSFHVEVLDPVQKTDQTIGSYPYTAYAYTGGDGGSGVTLPIDARYVFPFTFHGILEAASAGDELLFEINAGGGETRNLEEIVITGCVSKPGTSGSTIIRARRNLGVGGSSNSVIATVPYDEPTSASIIKTTSDIDLSNGDLIYVWVEDASGGQDTLSGYLVIA